MAERKYKCKDADMLVTSNVVMKNFDQHKAILLIKRKTWADPFAADLQKDIDDALELLGINTKTQQTEVTSELITLQKQALENLATFKIQLEVDFEEEPKELKKIENKLGFARHYDQVRTGDQQALVQLLTAFRKNMSPKLKKQIEAAGIDGQIMEDLIDMRDPINDTNIQQEALKGSTPNDTALNVEELNATYKKVIGICKIAPRLLPEVATASDDFSFSRILSRLR